jgi:O-6-methylguanine DNA methyltransferase
MHVTRSLTSLATPQLQSGPALVHIMAAIPTTWGTCGVVWKNHEHESPAGFAEPVGGALLCRIYTPGMTVPELRNEIFRAFPGCREILPVNGRFRPETVPEWFASLEAHLKDYYTASLRRWTQPQYADNWAFWRPRLDWEQVTPFQRRVLEIVAAIPSGTHLTYGNIARQLNKPQAARAVGSAVGRNPWPVLVPCHRVLGANRSLTGFSAPGGIATKQKMLDLEAG